MEVSKNWTNKLVEPLSVDLLQILLLRWTVKRQWGERAGRTMGEKRRLLPPPRRCNWGEQHRYTACYASLSLPDLENDCLWNIGVAELLSKCNHTTEYEYRPPRLQWHSGYSDHFLVQKRISLDWKSRLQRHSSYSDTFWPSQHCHCKRGGL